MKLSLLECHAKATGHYQFLIEYGGQKRLEEVIVINGVVPYVEYSQALLDILHKDVGEAKKMNRLIFDIFRGVVLDYPICVGNFQ